MHFKVLIADETPADAVHQHGAFDGHRHLREVLQPGLVAGESLRTDARAETVRNEEHEQTQSDVTEVGEYTEPGAMGRTQVAEFATGRIV